MRGFTVKFMACLLAAGFLATPGDVQAAPRTGVKKPKESRPNADKAYSLDDIMKEPGKYLEREVFFYCRFATTSNLFKNVNTRFNPSEHANFSVWPDKAILWDNEARKNILPTLYVTKNNPDILAVLRDVQRYELIAITGYVLNVYAKCPWIFVTAIERVELPSDRLCEPVIQHMQNGYEALKANFGGVAARHYEQALQFGLPPEYRAKAYEQLAQAYLVDNQLDKARDYLRLATEADRSDSLLHLALADVCIRMEEPEEALAHCEFALERSGRHPQVYGMMGEARAMLGDYVKAFADLNTASGTPGITAREKAMINVRRARIYVRAGRYPDAARAYATLSEPGEALAGDPKIHNEIGLFYERLYLADGDARYLDSAYAAYEEAAKLNRFEAQYLYNMAEVEYRRQKLSPAPNLQLVKELCEKIYGIEPEFTAARILEGRVLFAEGKPEEAEYRYQSVANQIGSDAMALMALAEAYLDLGRGQDAVAAVRRARELQPWNSRVRSLGDNLERSAANPVPVPVPASAPQSTYPGTMPETVQGANAMEAASPVGHMPQPVNLASAHGGGPESAPYEQVEWQPQEYQTSASPAPLPGVQNAPLPMTSVRLNDYAPSGPSVQDPHHLRPPERQSSPLRPVATPLNLGYTPGSGLAPVESGHGTVPPEEYKLDFEADFENGGFPRFGQAGGSGEAYASLSLREAAPPGVAVAAIPPAFSFAPGDSPVLLSEYQSTGTQDRNMPVRNVNLYRSGGGVRRPAEIIEKEPIRPLPTPDASVMAPSLGGGVYRAEVKLPGVAQGIGMSSDYVEAR